ncbi:MAG TPA: class I SAM-dependent methyltransferase [Pirellulales bacterium]|nr:class I SAM-dependent methyltransferase [Pirellulales bacterium]
MVIDKTPVSFSFGKNWAEFAERHLTEDRLACAREHLLGFLECGDLEGKYFLDIGSGSGLSSLAAFDAGAKRVVSFDIDPDSVATTRLLRRRRGDPDRWTVLHGSVLDAAFLDSIEPADIVYSRGVLHHTGRMWEALTNAITRMRPGGLLYVALYTTSGSSTYWRDVKRRYNAVGPLRKQFMEWHYVFRDLVWPTLRGAKNGWKVVRDVRKSRGMNYYTNVKDWLGGYPYEFAKVEEVYKFCHDRHGLDLKNLATGEANSEYLFSDRRGERGG